MVAVVASFFGGFLMANAFNRNELNSLRSENERLRTTPANTQDTSEQPSVDDNELKSKIAEADQNPSNFDFQKNLGLALYKYAAMKRDTDLLKESARILERASGLRKDDIDVLSGLGNAHFDLGYFGKDNSELIRSREFYTRVIDARPNDVEVRTDLGLTYFLVEPPDDGNAIAEFQRSLKSDPKHEKTLEFLIQALVRAKRLPEAEKYLSELRAVDPAGETIPGLKAKIAEAKAQPK